MARSPYKYDIVDGSRYSFISSGKRTIIKVVEFTPTLEKGVYNLGFGDQLPGGEIDDRAESNNGDIIKIFATIIDILQDFTKNNPSLTIVFTGSTFERTKLYNRILRTYYQSFSEIFIFSGLVENENGLQEVPFDPKEICYFLAFFVKRI